MDTVTSTDGTAIAFDRYGAGPGVILVGGAFQHRAIDTPSKHLAELLSDRFAVFHYDRRGRGDSGDTLPYAVEREVEDIAALITAAGGSVSLFGMSSGGALGLEAAASGLAVNKLALYEVPFMVDESGRLAMQAYSKQLATLLAEGREGDAVALAMTTFGAPPEAVEGMRQAPVWQAFESVAPTLAYDAAAMGDYWVPAERTASVTVPALVLDGGASPDFMHEAADALSDALPLAERRTLEAQTHDVAPEVIAPVLQEFFAA
jgi:pimeloyl-ACP methyl ester carboxylesterase